MTATTSIATTSSATANPVSDPSASLGSFVQDLPTISLDDINAAAELQTRVDRKYVLDHVQLATLLTDLADRLAVLDIGGRRSFRYESVYFDTADRQSFRSAVQGRRRRFKVRTRTYADTATTMLEVKTRGQRGATVKTRQRHLTSERDELNLAARLFVDRSVGHCGVAATLRPALSTSYSRATLVDLDDVARLTVDAELECSASGRSTRLASGFIVETKSAGPPCAADRHLWSVGIRPVKLSKFGTGLAALHPELSSNKWHRTLRHFSAPQQLEP
jgi:hypothetical protein